MHLRGTDGDSVALKVVAYQYPGAAGGEEHDANWLIVETTVSRAGRRWVARHAGLLTWEVENLARWLDDLANGQAKQQQMAFVEPHLRFEARSSGKGSVILRAFLESEARPPWAQPSLGSRGDLWVDLEASPDELRSAAAALHEQLRAFPRRPGRMPG